VRVYVSDARQDRLGLVARFDVRTIFFLRVWVREDGFGLRCVRRRRPFLAPVLCCRCGFVLIGYCIAFVLFWSFFSF